MVVSGLLEIYFRYHETRERVSFVQAQAVTGAARAIAQTILGIERHLKTVAAMRELAAEEVGAEYDFKFKKLLALAPALMDVKVIDARGRLHHRFSRSELIDDRKKEPEFNTEAFSHAKQGAVYFGPVYFLKGSQPYITLAVPIESDSGGVMGVLQAEVDLHFISEVVRDVKVGKNGFAYIVTRKGDIITHSDPSLVLQHLSAAHLHPWKAALSPVPFPTPPRTVVTTGLMGNRVMSSYAYLQSLDGAIFIERPLREAFGPLYFSLFRTSSLLLIALGMALFASVFLARRVFIPLGRFREGVERIGSGELDFRLAPGAGEEHGVVAEEINAITAALQEAHAGLEGQVAAQTQELLLANQRIKELDKMKSDFLSNVSHELRTPLTAIKGSVDNMLDGLTGLLNPRQLRYLTRVRSNTDRLSRLVGDLLDLTSIETNKVALHLTDFSLAGLIHEVVDASRAVAEQKSIRLSSDAAEETVHADHDKIAQVMRNLIDNAIKFTPPGGHVEIDARHDTSGWLRVSVTDSGPGIAPEEQDRIFEKFYQIMEGGRQKPKGTGLGLHISKTLVTMQGGELRVKSIPGRGSTFSFTVRARSVVGELSPAGG